MTTWSQMSQLIAEYDTKKNGVMQFLNVRSFYINALHTILSGKKPDQVLSYSDAFQLISQIIEYFPQPEKDNLSYQMALKVAARCISHASEAMLDQFTQLSQLSAFNETVCTLFLKQASHSSVIAAAEVLVEILKNYSRVIKKQRIDTLLSQAYSLWDFMATLSQVVKRYDRVTHWYKVAVQCQEADKRIYRQWIQFYIDTPKSDCYAALSHFKSVWAQQDEGINQALDQLASLRADVAMLLAKLYEKGENNIKSDGIKATHYYRLASQLGEKAADIWLAHCFYKGLHQQKSDEAKAVFYHRRAAEKCYLPSVRFLCRFYRAQADYPLAIHYAQQAKQLNDAQCLEAIEQCAKQGDTAMQYELGYFYHQSGSMEASLSWLIMAIQQHHAQATSYLRSIELDGETLFGLAEKLSKVPDCQVLADECYKKAVDKRYLPAVTYQAKRSGLFDDFLLAAECGDSLAEDTLQRLAEEGEVQLAKKLADYYDQRDAYRSQFWKKQSACPPLKSDDGGENALPFLLNMFNLGLSGLVQQ